MPASRFHRSLGTVATTALAVSLVSASVTTPAFAADTTSTIAAIAKGQTTYVKAAGWRGGFGPCGAGPGFAGYYATGTGQHNSCATPGTNGGPAHAWCADFAGWVWQQAGVPNMDSRLDDMAYSFLNYNGGANVTKTPAVGDAVVFSEQSTSGADIPPANWPSKSIGIAHVAIVVAVPDSGHITVVGGNDNGEVEQETIPSAIGSAGEGHYVYRYVTPGTATPPPAPTPAAVTSLGTWNGTTAATASPQAASGQIMLTATETNASRLWYYLDNTNPAAGGTGLISATDSGGAASPAHKLVLNTASLANGNHTVTAAAFDAGNANQIDSTKTITISVNNMPPAAKTSPALAPLPNGDFDVAWQAADTNKSLWLGTGTGGNMWNYGNPYVMGVAPGTNPSIVTQSDGSWVAAWQGADANHTLWLATGSGSTMTSYGNPHQMGVAAGTSPSLVVLPGGGWEVAWQGADTHHTLWLATGTGTVMNSYGNPYQMGVAAGTNPSLAAMPDGSYTVAWQAADSGHTLWLATGTGTVMNSYGNPYQMGVAAGSSPSLVPLATGGWEAAWHGADTNGTLWLATGTGTVMNSYGNPYQMGVAAGTNPSLAAMPDGSYTVAWQAADSGHTLWLATGTGTVMNSYGNPYQMGVAAGSSPSLVPLATGGWEAAWHGADTNGTLWLATGTGTVMNSYGNPYQMGVA
ncbi:CHAP domain-containing protein [Streptomyces sp. NPDC053429]|uniref:CHAP domain-containing protein n=1 Tax=Streptomyces sp. NPDC053429 TaxID=3365702 RepID=UPI0037CE5153